MSKMITLSQFRFEAPIDRCVTILKDGRPLDRRLDDYFSFLTIAGVNSHHSMRAYAYDLMLWARFLDSRQINIWSASQKDLEAYRRERRTGKVEARVAISTWNRSIASLDKFYAWATERKYTKGTPFAYRKVRRSMWRYGGETVNSAYERSGDRRAPGFVTLAAYEIFRDKGLSSELTRNTGSRATRTRERNISFADLVVSTGLRLEEASSLLEIEITSIPKPLNNLVGIKNIRFELPKHATKGNRGRSILLPYRVVSAVENYIKYERKLACEKFRKRGLLKRISEPILVSGISGKKAKTYPENATIALEYLSPSERRRLVICDRNGLAKEPAALWLTEVGLPLKPNSWEVIFKRASEQCCRAGHQMEVWPHQLRHTFAVYMLAMLIKKTISRGGTSELSQLDLILGDPLQILQRLLGHSSITTTYIYLDHLSESQTVVDEAVSDLYSAIAADASIEWSDLV